MKPKTNFGTPARDRTIEFGKHKGKMLGTLPSSYLKWVSQNLRGDRRFEEWAELAEQVLEDPLYRERIEWEHAYNVLSGDRVRNYASDYNAVDELWEIKDRFDWDFEDDEGWSKVDLKLLGTSYGGRIPRNGDKKEGAGNRRNVLERGKKKTEIEISPETEDGGDQSSRRRLRRLRQRGILKKVGDKVGISENIMGKFVNADDTKKEEEAYNNGELGEDKDRTAEVNRNLFPGREALFNKALKLNNNENRNRRKLR